MRARLDTRSRRAVVGFSVTQIVGWGSTYYLPSVLARPMMGDLGLSHEMIFAGVTLMLVLGAFLGPRAGFVMQQRGVRGVMTAGWLATGAGLGILAFSQGFASYMLAWIVIGLASPFSMSQGALTGLAAVSGPSARRAIAMLMVLSGLSSTIFWPVIAALEEALGWRGACVILALIHLFICAPIPWIVMRVPKGNEPEADREAEPEPAPLLRPEQRRLGFILAAVTFSASGLVSWGLPLHLIEIVARLGQPGDAAVFIAALVGPAQLVARFVEMTAGQRVNILTTNFAALALMPVAVLLPIVFGPSLATVLGLVLLYGVTSGLVSVARNVLPLMLFGRAGYGLMLGRLALPQNLAFAVAPLLYAWIMDSFGTGATLVLSLAPMLLAVASMMWLMRIAR